MTTYLTPSQLIENLESVKIRLRSSSSKLKAIKPDAARFQDARGSWFVGTRKVIIQVQADLMLMEEHLSKIDWWQRHSPNVSPKDLDSLLREYIRGRYFLLFHLVVSQLEESLRRMFEYAILNPKYRGNGLANITNELLQHVDSLQLTKLFELVRAVRNTIHNNGIYRPPTRGGIDRFEWKGQTYEFRDGWPPNIAWDFLIWLLLELNDAMSEIITSPKISAVDSIPRWTEFELPE